jgi:anti-sigma B factor antagonist
MELHPGGHGGAQVRIDQCDSVWVVSGEVDYDTAGMFGRRLRSATERPGPIVLDMSGVSFMDTSGIRELVRLRRTGRDVVILRPSCAVQLILELTHLDEVLTVEPSMEQAG